MESRANIPKPGGRVIVRTPDRREYAGRLIEIERRQHGREFAVVKLDSGWVTSYPVTMVFGADD